MLRGVVPVLAALLAALAPTAGIAGEQRVLATTADAQPLALDAPAGVPLRVMLAPPPTVSANLGQALQTAAMRDQIYLSLQGLRIDRPVTAVFDVYFGLPAGTAPSPDGPYYVGDFSFFDAQSGRKSAVFNVTDRVRGLLGTRLLAEQAAVTIVAKGQSGNVAKPTIGKVELLAIAP